MKVKTTSRLLASVLAATMMIAGIANAADKPTPEEMAQMMPKPTAEHQWLDKFVGTWQSDVKSYMEPGQPPMVSTGTDVVKPVGEFWVVSNYKGTMMDQPFFGNMTLGYDADKHMFVSTWVDSMSGHLWNYEGNVDATGKILTLEAEGPCPMHGGKNVKFRDVTEFKTPDTKINTMYVQDEDGKWNPMMTIESKRVSQ